MIGVLRCNATAAESKRSGLAGLQRMKSGVISFAVRVRGV